MIVTDFNKMATCELEAINKGLGIEFESNDGKIVSAVTIDTDK